MQVGALVKHWSLRLLAPERAVQQTYGAFRTLLDHDGRSHELMAEFEAVYHGGRQEDLARTRRRYRRFAEAVAGMVTALEQMQPGQAGILREYFNKYDFYVRLLLAPPEEFLIPPFVVGHDQPVEPGLVGNKCSQLLAIKQAGAARIPEGFTITATTYGLLVEHNRLRPALDLLLAGIDPDSAANLKETSQALMTLVRNMDIPDQVARTILAEYDRLPSLASGQRPRVAVRSSALHEDGAHSFAGQYHSRLGVGRGGLLAAYLEVVASKYSPQALVYRLHAGIGDEEAAMAVLVLTMVDARASGVIYSRDPSNGGGTDLLVHAVHGLGLPLVDGSTVPDVFLFPVNSKSPSTRSTGSQQERLILGREGLVTEPIEPRTRISGAITVEQAGRLARVARNLEQMFGEPQDIEWALDGQEELFILQSRPLRLEPAPPSKQSSEVVPTVSRQPLLASARPAAGGIAHGTIRHGEDLDREPPGGQAILVTRHIPPSLVRHIDKLAAVICEQGSVTGHFATVCREFGVVLLVEAAGALACLGVGQEATVDGNTGVVYPGRVDELLALRNAGEQRVRSAFNQRLEKMLAHITPLHLLDPADPAFQPQSCRSLHDIIRYAHEKAVQAMFGLGERAGAATSHCRRLATDLPIDIYLLDVGGAFADDHGDEITLRQLRAAPFLALWQGLGHPQVDWQSHLHFDWKGFGDMALSGGIAAGGSKEFASYALVGADYLNLNMRFGFHFTLLDCLCGTDSRANYCQLRFAGGGGEYEGRIARIDLVRRILTRLDFEVTVHGDLLDARLIGAAADELHRVLTEVGRLLGVTKVLDMVLQGDEIEERVARFFHESNVGPSPGSTS